MLPSKFSCTRFFSSGMFGPNASPQPQKLIPSRSTLVTAAVSVMRMVVASPCARTASGDDGPSQERHGKDPGEGGWLVCHGFCPQFSFGIRAGFTSPPSSLAIGRASRSARGRRWPSPTRRCVSCRCPTTVGNISGFKTSTQSWLIGPRGRRRIRRRRLRAVCRPDTLCRRAD